MVLRLMLFIIEYLAIGALVAAPIAHFVSPVVRRRLRAREERLALAAHAKEEEEKEHKCCSLCRGVTPVDAYDKKIGYYHINCKRKLLGDLS
jgi:hypothetical protein